MARSSFRRVRGPFGILCAAILIITAGCGGGGGGGGGSTTGSVSPLVLAANSIVYGSAAASGSAYNVTEMTPTGATPTVVAANVPDTIQLFAINPAAASQYALAADPTGAGTFGIYLSSSLTLTGATSLVAPAYLYVSSITVTQNGKYIVYSASSGSPATSDLYVVPITGGTPVDLGLSDGSTVSPADSDTIAFVAPGNLLANTGGVDEVYTRSLAAGVNGAATVLTSDASNHLMPAYSPNGATLAFWEIGDVDTLVTMTPGSITQTPIATPAGFQAQGEAFSNDGSTLVMVGELNGLGNISTAPASGAGPDSTIQSSSSLLGNYGVFWTDVNGRVAGSIGGMCSAARRHVRF